MTMSFNWFTPTTADSSTSVSSQLQLTFVISELQDLLTGIAALKQVVQAMPFLSSRSGIVLPIDCDQLIDALSMTRAMAEKGIVLLHPQDALGSYNYSLLLKLHLTVDKIPILLDLTERLRSSCAGDGSETAQILIKLQGEVSRLLHEQNKIEDEIGDELNALLLAVDG